MPPSFGGKSLVTRRCFTGALADPSIASRLHDRRPSRRPNRRGRCVELVAHLLGDVVGHGIEQIATAQPADRPHGMGPEEWIGVGQVADSTAVTLGSSG